MVIDKSRAVAFSGHRSFKKDKESLFDIPEKQTPEAVTERLCEIITMLVDEGFTDFLCGMAEGFDMLAAKAVLTLRIGNPRLRLTAAIPFPGQAAGFSDVVRSDYGQILAYADNIVTICPAYSADCFHRRNDWLVDNASLLVCYYNGSKGGTQYTVKRALKNRLRVINLF